MGNFITLLTRIVQIGNIVSLISNTVKKFRTVKVLEKDVLPTPTDCLLDALALADKIVDEMESVGLTLIEMADRDKGETLELKLMEFGLPIETYRQMAEWNERARFSWSSFRDELRILYRERMTKEQKNDVNKPEYKTRIKIESEPK